MRVNGEKPTGGEEVAGPKEICTELENAQSTLRSELEETRTELSSRIDEVRTELSSRIDETNRRVDGVQGEMKSGFDAMARRMTDSELRLATATTELTGTVRELVSQIRVWRQEDREEPRDDEIEKHIGSH